MKPSLSSDTWGKILLVLAGWDFEDCISLASTCKQARKAFCVAQDYRPDFKHPFDAARQRFSLRSVVLKGRARELLSQLLLYRA